MSDPIAILLVLTALLNFALGGVVLFNRRSDASVWFSAFTIFLGVWTVTMIGYRVSGDAISALQWMRFAYVSAIFIAVPFWYVALNFPEYTNIHSIVHVANWLFAFLFSFAILGSGLIVRSISIHIGGEKMVDQNPTGWVIYAFYFLFYFVSAHVILYLKYRKASGLIKKHLQFLFSSVFIGGEIFGVFFNLILPSPIFDEWRFIWTGPVLTAIVIVPVISYAITKHQLLNIKIVATETLVAAAIVLAFADVFFSRSLGEFALRFVIFIAVSAIGLLIIKSVLAEIRRREEVQFLARQLKSANERLEQLSKMKSNFISIASHQLRAPIGGVRSYLSMLHDGDFGKLPQKQRQIMELNIDVLDHTLHIIEMFLDVTKIESGKLELSRKPTNLAELAQGVIASLALSAERKGLTLHSQISSDLPIVNVDSEKIRNVMFNLIENAIKYTESGTITFDLHRANGIIECRVTDTGIGIEKKEIPKLFVKFVRAGGGFHVSHGSGLGLYIIKTLVEAHRGKVFVESPGPGKGSTFGFRLPLVSKRRHDVS